MLLLNPGPVTLSEGVRQALLGPDLCHREPEFSELQERIRARLLRVHDLDPAAWAAVLLTGSGTSAMEAMLTSLAPEAGHLLVIENGVYGERLSRIAAIHGIPHTRMHHDWGAPVDDRKLAELLAAGAYSHIAVVHHETTTGRLNDLATIAELARAHGVALLVDAVSSFGAEAIDFVGNGIVACAATANKCLHGVPGVSFVILRRAALKVDAPRPRTLYLDLASYLEQQDQGGTPFTQSVQVFYALDQALAEFFEAGGWRARRAHYRALAAQVRAGLRELGICALLPEGESSCVLHAYHLPRGIDYRHLHDRLKAAGFIIYAGQGALSRTLFRISTMGALDAHDMDRLLAAMARITGREDGG